MNTINKFSFTSLIIVFTLASICGFFNRASAVETEVFVDGFESGVANWSLGTGWSVVSEYGNNILQGAQHNFATAYLEGVADKLEFKLKLLNGAIHVNIRSSAAPDGIDRYFIGFSQELSSISKQLGDNFQDLESGQGISLNVWYDVKIEVIGDWIFVYVDDSLLMSVQDEDIIEEGGVSFETHEDSKANIDDVRVETTVPDIRIIQVEDVFSNGEHKGDLTLEGRDLLILDGGNFEQFGNIYLKDSSKLIVFNSTLTISRYQRPLNHWGIHLQDSASLIIENSELLPGSGALLVIEAGGRSSIDMKHSPTQIHLFGMYGDAVANVESSEIVGSIGGSVSLSERANVKIVDSTIGAVSLGIPKDASFEASGFRTGLHKYWNLHENASVAGINYNLTFIDSILVDDLLGPGPFERGWTIYTDSHALVNIKESELRKVIINLNNEKVDFLGLSLETVTDFIYRDIYLDNVLVTGQWGIFLENSSDVTVKDSEGFWTFIYDDSKLKLVNTHMNEFDPRDFRGEIIFENCRWDTAAEIIGNNDFTIKGSLLIGNIGGFSWENSRITRVFDVIGKPDTELTLRKGNETFWQGTADENGALSFNITFNDMNYNDFWELNDHFGNKLIVGFFSKTPINFTRAEAEKSDIIYEETFFDGFESGVANWSLGTGWSVVSEYGNNILQGAQHNFATAYLEGVADKLEFKLKLLNGNIHSNIRSSPAPEGINRYYIGFNKDFSNIGKQLGDNFQDLNYGPGISLNLWHDIKIEVIGDWIFVYVDDSLLVAVQDEDIIEEGGVSFETLEDSKANIDDVRITQQLEQEFLEISSISCNSSHTSTNFNDHVFIIGELNPSIEGADVELVITAPDGSTNSEVKKTAYDGSFIFILDADQIGTWNFHTIWDGDEEYEGAISEEVSLLVMKIPTTVTIQSSETVITLGDTAAISGSIFPAISSTTIIFSYTKPDGSNFTRTTITGSDGSFSDSFSFTEIGHWSVRVSWEGDSLYRGAMSQVESFFVEAKPTRGIPGFPMECIIIGLMIGVYALTKLQSMKGALALIEK